MGNLRKVIATISLAAILSTLVTQVAFAKSPFTDVPDSHWFTTEGWDVKAKDAGVFTKTVAMPDAYVIRADLAKMIAAAAGLDMTNLEAFPTGVFTDIKSTDYWYQPVQAGRQANIFTEKTKFDAAANTNRAQAAKVIVQAFGLAAAVPNSAALSDVKLAYTGADEWMNNIYTAYCYGLVKGVNGKFLPGNNISRAELAKMLVVAKDVPTLKAECKAGPVVVDPTDPTDPVVVGGDVSASIDDSSPDAATLADGTAFDKLLSVNLSAGPDGASIEEITLTSFGKVSDSLVKASVWNDGVRVGNVVSFSEGKATVVFNTPVEIAKNDSVVLDFAVNLDSTIGSGTVGVSIDAATDIVLNGGTVDGDFPMNSPEFGIVDGSNSVAALTFDVVNLSSTNRAIDPQTAYKLTTFKLSETASKEDVIFNGITLFNNGNTSDKDLQNITVKDQEGKTLGSLEQSTDKIATIAFDEPYTMKQGTTRNFDVYVDVVSGSTRTGQFIVQNDYDVLVTGVKSKSSIIPTAGTLTDTGFPMGDRTSTQTGYNFITVNEGSASVSKDNSSPSGDVTLGSSDVILGTFTVQAQGEDVELQKVALDFGNGSDRTTTTSNATSYFDCVKTASGSTTCDDTSKNDLSGSIKVVTADGKTLYTVSSNTLSIWNNSPAYATLSAYQTVKAGTSLKLNVVGSLNSNATYTGAGENMKAGINKIYYYKKASLKYADTGSATANTMAVTTSSLSVSSDTAYGAQTVVAGTANVKLGSFNIKGSSGEKVNITSIALQVFNSSTNSTDVKNVKVYKGTDNTGTQLGTTQATVTHATDMTLSVSGFMLEKGEEVKVSVYGDVASGYNSGASGTSLVKIAASGVAGTGQTSQSSASGPTAQLSLQTITVETSGALTLAVADDSPVTKILVAGTPYTDANASVAKFKLSASKAEDIYLTKLVLRLATEASDVSVSDATLYGSTSSSTLGDVIGTVHAMQADSTRPGYIQWDWSDTSRPKVASNSSYYVTVKANIVSSGQTATVSDTSPAFVLADVKAEGSSSITPTNATADLIPNSIVIGTFAADSAKVKLASIIAADATTMTVSTDVGGTTGNFTDFNTGVGFYCMINADNDAAYDAGEEIVYVTGVGASGVYQVQRGLFGTTAAAVTPVALGSGIGNVYCVAAKTGVAHKVLNTKLTASTDTTGLDTAAQTDMKLAKVIFTAAANSADAAENKATVTKIRVTVTSTTASAANFSMYPQESSSNTVTGAYVSATVVEFLFGDSNHNGVADTTFSSTVYDDVVEGMSRTYIIEADTTVGTNGQISLKLANTGSSAAAVYGTSGDVEWSDGAETPTTISWLNQPDNASSLTLRTFSAASASGTPDTTAPTLTSFAEAADSLTIVWDEAMSPAAITSATITNGVIAGSVNGAGSATLFTYASGGTNSMTSGTLTPTWTSTTTLTLTGLITVGGDPSGNVTPAAAFRDGAGNANATSVGSSSGTLS